MEERLEIAKLLRQLEEKTKELKIRGIKRAKAEKEYKVALNKEALRMRVELDYPVTLIDKVVHGSDAVADLRFKRDVAESVYNCTLEEINYIKTKIRVKEEEIRQDYAMTRYQ